MLRALLTLVVAFLLLPETALAGQDLGVWKVTRYYSPLPDQERYYNGWKANPGVCKTSNLYYAPYGGKYAGSYSAELCMQSDGEPFFTADGTDVREEEPFAIGACARQYLGRTVHVENVGYVRCADTGGGVTGKHIDLWAGVGSQGYENIRTAPSGLLRVHLKPYETMQSTRNDPVPSGNGLHDQSQDDHDVAYVVRKRP